MEGRRTSETGQVLPGNSFEDRRDAAVIAVFLATGIRVSELSAIRYRPDDRHGSDVDLEEAREIRVRGKGGRERTVRIGHEAARRLDRYLRVRSKHELAYRPELWLGVNNRGPLDRSGICQLVVRRGEECGVRLHPHRFRHHFSHAWLERGGAEGDLMELNGWVSPQMLTRYGASARGARARRSYDRVMNDLPGRGSLPPVRARGGPCWAEAPMSAPGLLGTPGCGWCAVIREIAMSAPQIRARQPRQMDAGVLGAEIGSFRLHLAAEGKAPKTIRLYTEAVAWFAAARLLGEAGKTGWEQADRRDVQEWMTWLLGRYSDAYASNQYRALQQFFKWLAVEEDLPDPMAGLRPPHVTTGLVPVFTGAELARWSARARAGGSPSGGTRPSSRCSRRPVSGCRSCPASATARPTRGTAIWTCGSGRSPYAARAESPRS